MKDYYFTFGAGQTHPTTGASLMNYYLVISAAAYEEARAIMVLYFGLKWSFQYKNPEEAGIERFKLKRLEDSQWPKIPGGRS